MSNTPILTQARNTVTSKSSRIPSLWLRRLLYMSPFIVTLLLTWCWEKYKELDKDLSNSELEKRALWIVEEWPYRLTDFKISPMNLRSRDKIVLFTKNDFIFDPAIKAWLEMEDSKKLALWFPSSDNKKIQAFLSLTQDERIALWVEKDYQEFLALLKKSKS